MTAIIFDKAYRRGLQRTINFLMSRGVPYGLAPDLAQSAWTRGWERREQLRSESAIHSWVNSIALNQSRRMMRSVKREEEWTPELKENRTTCVDSAAIDLAGILKACEPKERELLNAQLIGSSAKELARAEGVTETAMRLRLLRARRAARDLCRPVMPLPVMPLMDAA